MALLELRDVKVYFSIRKGLFSRPMYVRAVDGVSLSLDRGETVAVIGESGSGKTTLGRAALRLVNLHEGKVIFDGRDITGLDEGELKWFRRRAQMIFQDPFSALNPFHTIKYILEEPLILHRVGDEEERREMVVRALEDVKLSPPEDFLRKYPHMLSGGQRQRVVIARALILRPDLIIADEPVSMLDVSIRVEILTMMRELQRRYNIAFMYITHDISTAKYFSDKVLIMYAGKPVEYGKFSDIVKEPLHPYTQALIEAVPDPDPHNRFRERKVPHGEPPSLVNPPKGCRFHPRCPLRMEICEKDPPLVRVGDRVVACWLYVEGRRVEAAAGSPQGQV